MAMVQTPNEKVGKTPRKKKNYKARSNKKAKEIYCILCRKLHLRHEAQEHIHGMLHHRELETVLDKDSFHECQACKKSSMCLNEYAEHISTAQHKAKLKGLISRNEKPLTVEKTLTPETVCQILQRNRSLKKVERKASKKKKKKLKQLAGQQHAEIRHGATRKNPVGPKVMNIKKSNDMNLRILKQMQGTHQQGSNYAIFQNKENKVSSVQRPPHQRESTLQSQSGRLAAGPSWQLSCVWDHMTDSTHQLRYNDNSSVNNQCSNIKTDSSETDRLARRPNNTQAVGATCPAGSQHDKCNKPFRSATDFTSDHLPQEGAVIFNHSQNKSTGSSQPGQEGSRWSAHAAAANRSTNAAAPIRDVDVNVMLRQIRRALGVREPCRADREARRQSSEAGVRLAEREQPTGVSCRNYTKEAAPDTSPAATTSMQSSLVNSSVNSSNIAPAMPKQSVRTTQGLTQHCEHSSVVAGDSNGPSHSSERESQGAFDSETSLRWAASSEPNLNITRKVRIAHKPRREKEAGLQPTLNKLLSLSGARSKLPWREMNEEMRRKKQKMGKGMPRFGIELTNPLSDQEGSTQAEDLPLSEGFHWESLPDAPSLANWTALPPPTQDATDDSDSNTKTQPDSQMRQHLEQPGAAQEVCSNQKTEVVSVKVEPNLEDVNGESSSAKKRKHKHDGIPDKEATGKKKKKSNKDQDQMDQLLTVSLREEELSHSLQDLDKSLIQARNALQAAYADVQRLLLLRQQCTAEVNSLRAKRIEILQGMQGGFQGASNAAEKPSTSSAGATSAMQLSSLSSSSAFPTSSSQQPPLLNPAPSTSQPHPSPIALPSVPLKREVHEPPTVTCNPATPQVPVNQPVPLFPSDLCPSLLLTSPHLAAPTTAVTSLTQLRTVSANPSPELSTGQQVHVKREELRNCAMLSKEESDSDSVEEMEENPGQAAEKTISTVVPERDQNVSPAALDDNEVVESDDSLEMMEPSNLEVIAIDESDNEETISNVPAQPERPQKSVSVEFSSVSSQTVQQNEEDRKVQPTLAPLKDTSVPPERFEVGEDEEPSLGAFVKHTGPVHGLQIHEGLLYTCSGDNTARAYSLMSRECQAVFKGHTNKINCLLVSSLPNMPARLYTGSSDETIRCYSLKSQKCLEQISLLDRVLCLHVAWNILFAGLANGSVASYDLKTLKQLDVFECHGPRGVSCLGTAQEGARRVLLVGSYDSTISVRDAKSGLLLRSLQGHTKTVLCMKVVNDLVFSGSSDTSVHAHNIHTGELIRIYKGHSHAVTSIVILGKVMITACLDQLVRVYELQSHDRLQVYGGHSDMVMCMAVHKSVIYTGCYDGSVQAVKLNLMKNYRCWWQNCSLIFGIAEHLMQHLVRDHTNPNLHRVECRWKGCGKIFAKQELVRQELPEHMQSHVENDSKVQP